MIMEYKYVRQAKSCKRQPGSSWSLIWLLKKKKMICLRRSRHWILMEMESLLEKKLLTVISRVAFIDR